MENSPELESGDKLTRVMGNLASIEWMEGDLKLSMFLEDNDANFEQPEISVLADEVVLEFKFSKVTDRTTEVHLIFNESELYGDNTDDLISLIGYETYHKFIELVEAIRQDETMHAFKQEGVEFDSVNYRSQIDRWLELRQSTLDV